jgi:hypothetical protein
VGKAGAVVPALVIALLAWSWFVTGLSPFTTSTTGVVLATGGLAMVFGARWWPRPAPPPTLTLRAVGPWLLVAGVLVVWQLVAFVGQPRDDHPTISSLTNAALDGRFLRTVAFAGWAVASAWLARR